MALSADLASGYTCLLDDFHELQIDVSSLILDCDKLLNKMTEANDTHVYVSRWKSKFTHVIGPSHR
jgi:hypothetical protein